MRTKVALVAVLALMVNRPAGADGLDFKATLDSIRVQARPGQMINRSFLLTLAAKEKRTNFKSKITDFWRSEDGAKTFYDEPGTVSRSCGRWVSLNPVEAAVSGGETLTVRLTIAVPLEIEEGGYWCALTVDQVPDPLEESSGVQMRFYASVSIGIFIYIDPVKRAASVTDVSVLANEIRMTLRNDGNAPIGAEGRVEFIRPGEQKPTTVAIVPRQTLLPEPVRTGRLIAKLPDAAALPAGEYMVRAILDIGLNHYIGVQKKLQIVR